MSAVDALSRLTFVPAGPILLNAVRERLAPVDYFRRDTTILNRPCDARPVLQAEFTTFYGAERGAALLGTLLTDIVIRHDGRRWVVDGDVVGDWS